MKQLISIIAILMSFSAIGQDSAAFTANLPTETVNKLIHPVGALPAEADTITLTSGHAEILPKLLQQQAELQAMQAQINEKIMLVLTAYIEPKEIQKKSIQLSEDSKKIIVK
jgi:hypothetical protein